MIFITRRERFSSAHRLWNDELSAEDNIEIFDKCANYNFHGHNYVLFVTVAGEIDPKTGYVIDTKVLKKIIIEEVISKVDHRNLNVDVDFLQGLNTTTENLLVAFWKKLQPKINNERVKLYKLQLWETENNMGEYFGD